MPDDLPLPADQHHFDTACDGRPYCVIPSHHDVDALTELGSTAVIEPTHEMIRAFDHAMTDVCLEESETSAGLTAVLAIVERDNAVEPYCLEESGIPGVRCGKRRNHVPVHYAFLPTGGMSW